MSDIVFLSFGRLVDVILVLLLVEEEVGLGQEGGLADVHVDIGRGGGGNGALGVGERGCRGLTGGEEVTFLFTD